MLIVFLFASSQNLFQEHTSINNFEVKVECDAKFDDGATVPTLIDLLQSN